MVHLKLRPEIFKVQGVRLWLNVLFAISPWGSWIQMTTRIFRIFSFVGLAE